MDSHSQKERELYIYIFSRCITGLSVSGCDQLPLKRVYFTIFSIKLFSEILQIASWNGKFIISGTSHMIIVQPLFPRWSCANLDNYNRWSTWFSAHFALFLNPPHMRDTAVEQTWSSILVRLELIIYRRTSRVQLISLLHKKLHSPSDSWRLSYSQ